MQEVQNLPVTLLRLPNAMIANRLLSNVSPQREAPYRRSVLDAPILVLVNIITYFCFLEQLLVNDIGARSLVISLPISCFMGLLASLIACIMAKLNNKDKPRSGKKAITIEMVPKKQANKKDIGIGLLGVVMDSIIFVGSKVTCMEKAIRQWTWWLDLHAIRIGFGIRFAIVVVIAHIFYEMASQNLPRILKVGAIFSILISSVSGIGITISVTALLVECLLWRIRRNARVQQANGSQQQSTQNDLEGEQSEVAEQQVTPKIE
ncbi:hypothetical protein HPP92_016564 [Vanilla planifolia]|uniref:Uncharacterized protein n=1 Tax=Vanilla planifolia TaxID=51239 RepID=A0A835QCG8_VANPL|nr:hypothetical protein HPP92_016564 [Vanilla planifolia]